MNASVDLDRSPVRVKVHPATGPMLALVAPVAGLRPAWSLVPRQRPR